LSIQLQKKGDLWSGLFSAMACPCELLVETEDKTLAHTLTHAVWQEASRIEQKFSRYLNNNIIYQINNANGSTITVDEETSQLLDFAAQCYELSEHKFDITSGVLRRAWKFDGSNNLPSSAQIGEIIPLIGWHNVSWRKPYITLLPGMEIDFGGLGKEYAVDQAAKKIADVTDCSLLVNFGGDIYAGKARANNKPWVIGVDNPYHSGTHSLGKIELFRGGLTTSGDARKFLMKDGKRYSHILDPLTGWPVPDAPHSVTVIANTCLEAGMLSTFAMLNGSNAEQFLEAQNVKYWCVR
jgi:FAD:protein FMN transferase